MTTKAAVRRAIPLTTLLALRRPRPQGSHWFFPPEIYSSCTSTPGSARATTQHCRQPWRP